MNSCAEWYVTHTGNDHRARESVRGKNNANSLKQGYDFAVNNSDEQLQREILALISSEQGIKLEDISPDKSLNLDLGIDGEAAIELLLAYSAEFHVDIEPLGEEWDRYFGSEPSLRTLLQQTTSFLTRKHHPKLPLPVSRLVASARAGRWIPPAA
jgi:acyl carrier protein